MFFKKLLKIPLGIGSMKRLSWSPMMRNFGMKPLVKETIPSTVKSKTQQDFLELMVMCKEIWVSIVIFLLVCLLAGYKQGGF